MQAYSIDNGPFEIYEGPEDLKSKTWSSLRIGDMVVIDIFDHQEQLRNGNTVTIYLNNNPIGIFAVLNIKEHDL